MSLPVSDDSLLCLDYSIFFICDSFHLGLLLPPNVMPTCIWLGHEMRLDYAAAGIWSIVMFSSNSKYLIQGLADLSRLVNEKMSH